MASATWNVTFTITTPSAFGSRCLAISRARLAPAILAAETKSRSRSVSTSPRIRRAGTGQNSPPMISEMDSTEVPYLAATISSTNRNGMDSSTSTTRIINASMAPPASPAIAPHREPMTMLTRAAKNPTSSATCPPIISSPSSSYPWSVVPSGCPDPGARKESVRTEFSTFPW
ncbi:MAG TPA: hypothetical protein VKU39_11055 [Streptosporangiaceae bacterium]|nr:hypothetical protein [Streptosporangiaceae bacterium]